MAYLLYYGLLTGLPLKSATEEWRSYLSSNGLSVIPKEEEEVEIAEPTRDEVPLISNMSPPFVRAPLEDRSKYEKLKYNVEDVSSDDSEPNGQGKYHRFSVSL